MASNAFIRILIQEFIPLARLFGDPPLPVICNQPRDLFVPSCTFLRVMEEQKKKKKEITRNDYDLIRADIRIINLIISETAERKYFLKIYYGDAIANFEQR